MRTTGMIAITNGPAGLDNIPEGGLPAIPARGVGVLDKSVRGVAAAKSSTGVGTVCTVGVRGTTTGSSGASKIV